MSLSTPQAIFGVHSVAAYNPDTGVPYGIAKVNGSLTISNSGELIELLGGSSLYPWKVESGPITTEGSLTLREFPDWLYQAFLGNTATTGAAEAAGGVSALSNMQGTSCFDATTGIASVDVATAADLKTGMYVIKAASATTVDIYALTDVDFAVGTDLTYVDDTLKITSSALTVPDTGGTVAVPSLGVELTGGSGTVAMTAGDTCFFDLRAINDGYTTAIIGGDASTYVDIGLKLAAQKQGDGTNFMIDMVRAKAIGLPFNFTEKAFMESEVSLKAFKDTTRDAVFRITRVDNTN